MLQIDPSIEPDSLDIIEIGDGVGGDLRDRNPR
jgi:hypothetical protein